MYFVTSPAKVVNSIQLLLGEKRSTPPILQEKMQKPHGDTIVNETIIITNSPHPNAISENSIKTRGKVKNIITKNPH